MNSCNFIGRITKDPQLKKTQSGVSVVSFTLAVNRQFTSANGEREADFINVIAWRGTADFMQSYVKKGNLLGVDGRIQTRSYEQDGKNIYVTEVVADSVQLLETIKQEVKPEQGEFYEEPPKPLAVDDEDLPF